MPLIIVAISECSNIKLDWIRFKCTRENSASYKIIFNYCILWCFNQRASD